MNCAQCGYPMVEQAKFKGCFICSSCGESHLTDMAAQALEQEIQKQAAIYLNLSYLHVQAACRHAKLSIRLPGKKAKADHHAGMRVCIFSATLATLYLHIRGFGQKGAKSSPAVEFGLS